MAEAVFDLSQRWCTFDAYERYSKGAIKCCFDVFRVFVISLCNNNMQQLAATSGAFQNCVKRNVIGTVKRLIASDACVAQLCYTFDEIQR